MSSDLIATVKTSNGTTDDIAVPCKEGWTVFDLKAHLSQHHPVQPPVRIQKLIHAGRLLENEESLNSLSGNNNSIVFHLVISPVYMRTYSLPNPEPTPTTEARSQPAAGAASSFQRTLSDSANQQSGHTHPWLRHRSTQQPNEMQRNAYPMPGMGWPNPYLMSQYNPVMAAQMAQWYQSFQPGRFPGPAQQPGEPNPDLPANNVRGEVANEQDIELPDDMAVNGGGGGMLMGAGAVRHRDLVDYMYMLMMLVFMGTIGFLTGSLKQFVIFSVGVIIILLNQGGWFNLQRRQVVQPQHEPEREQPQQQQGDAADQVDGDAADQVDGDATRDVATDGEDQEELAQQPPPRPGILNTLFVFVTSFFTSLLPQQIPELLDN